jgi:hypothetical protein
MSDDNKNSTQHNSNSQQPISQQHLQNDCLDEENKYDDSSDKLFIKHKNSASKGGNLVQNKWNNQTIICNISDKSIVPQKSIIADNNTVLEVNESNSNSQMDSPVLSDTAILENNLNNIQISRVSLNTLENIEDLENPQRNENRLSQNYKSKSPSLIESDKYFDFISSDSTLNKIVNKNNLSSKFDSSQVNSNDILVEFKEFLNIRFSLDDLLDIIKRQTENRTLQSILHELKPDYIEVIYSIVSNSIN